MNDIHTCSLSCHHPACIKVQRDALAQWMLKNHPEEVMAALYGKGADDEGVQTFKS